MTTAVMHEDEYTAFENKLLAKGRMDRTELMSKWTRMTGSQKAGCVNLVRTRRDELNGLYEDLIQQGAKHTPTLKSEALIGLLLVGMLVLKLFCSSGSPRPFFEF